MRRRLAVPLLVVVAVLVVAGGVVAVIRSADEDQGPPSDPRAAVVAALAGRASDTSDSVRYIIRNFVEGAGVTRQLLVYEGVADLERQRYSARGRFIGDEPVDTRELRLVRVRPVGVPTCRR